MRSVWSVLSFLLSLFLLTAAAGASEIAPGVHLVRGGFEPGRQPDGNSVVFVAPEGLVVVDTGRHVAHTTKVLDLCATLGGAPRAVINTHWHLDHVGGNRLIRERFPQARVHASAAIHGALEGFLANYARQLEQMVASARDPDARQGFETELGLIRAGSRLAPDEVIASSGTQTIAGRSFEVHLEKHAVTAGDVWLLDTASGVLVAGDLVTLPAPFLDTACPRGWEAALGRLAASEFRMLVPGHGPPMTPQDLESYRAAFGGLLECAASERVADDCIDGWFRDGGSLLATEDTPFARSLVRYYVEGVLRGDPAAIEARCSGS
jgi:glyoxylase-like metal-dependent hydrolase (beta-lactamase superfamily II)